jgi:RHS repeat-associated protein
MTNSSAGVSPASVYSYDAENRPTTVTSNGVTELQCWYDGAGHRIAKREIVNGQTNTFQYVWDGWNLVAVLGEDGTLKEYYTRGVGIAGDIGTLVAVTQYSGGSPIASYHLHNNHRGDVIMARQGTNTVATLDYAPYGELRSQAGTYTPRLRFSSKEYDASTGFYHFPYRYYAPQWARWMTRDPIEEDGGVNAYVYVSNKPVRNVDPYGEQEFIPPSVPPAVPPGLGQILGKCLSSLDKKKLEQIYNKAKEECGKKKAKGSGGCCVVSFCAKVLSSVTFEGGSGNLSDKSCAQVKASLAQNGFYSGCSAGFQPYFDFIDW